MKRISSFAKTIVLFAVVALIIALGACAPKAPTATKPAEPKFKGTVVVGEWQEPQGLNEYIFSGAHTTAIMRALYYRPATLTDQDRLEPEMLEQVPTVKNGGISADYKTITLKFKDGFKWHDGKPVTSGDLKFTWQFIMNPATGAQSQSGWDNIESIDTPDKLTAVLHFKVPDVGFIDGHMIEPLMPKHLLEGVADPAASEYMRKPVGNGPFTFKEWVPGDHLTVVANPDAPLPPKVETIIFKFVPDVNTMLAMLRVGDIDVAWDMRESYVEELKKISNVSTVTVPGVSIERYNVNLRDPKDLTKPHPILSDVRVRKALILAMDRATFVDKLLGGAAKVAVTDMDNTPWYNQDLKPYPYDRLRPSSSWKRRAGRWARMAFVSRTECA